MFLWKTKRQAPPEELTELQRQQFRMEKLRVKEARKKKKDSLLGVCGTSALEDYGYSAVGVKWHNSRELVDIFYAFNKGVTPKNIAAAAKRPHQDILNLVKNTTLRSFWALQYQPGDPMVYPIGYLDSSEYHKVSHNCVIGNAPTSVAEPYAPMYLVKFPEGMLYRDPKVYINAVTLQIITLEGDSTFTKDWSEINREYNAVCKGYSSDAYPVLQPRYGRPLPELLEDCVTVEPYMSVEVTHGNEPLESPVYKIGEYYFASAQLVKWTFFDQYTLHSAMVLNSHLFHSGAYGSKDAKFFIDFPFTNSSDSSLAFLGVGSLAYTGSIMVNSYAWPPGKIVIDGNKSLTVS